VAQRRFVPLSSAEAVLRYWSDFIPSWAGAISIDLLPVVLVLILMIVHDAIRRDSGALDEAETITAAEMLRAMALYRQMAAMPQPPVEELPPDARAASTDPELPAGEATDATVTPIDVRKRSDTPIRQ
jgi:hypothetical protein